MKTYWWHGTRLWFTPTINTFFLIKIINAFLATSSYHCFRQYETRHCTYQFRKLFCKLHPMICSIHWWPQYKYSLFFTSKVAKCFYQWLSIRLRTLSMHWQWSYSSIASNHWYHLLTTSVSSIAPGNGHFGNYDLLYMYHSKSIPENV